MKHLYKIFFFCFFLIIIIIYSCNKEDDKPSGNVTEPLVFSSLVASRNTIIIGDTTLISAIASGTEITYTWSKTLANSNITGSGSHVIYSAPPCSGGDDIITCTVTDCANNSLSKQVTITVSI